MRSWVYRVQQGCRSHQLLGKRRDAQGAGEQARDDPARISSSRIQWQTMSATIRGQDHALGVPTHTSIALWEGIPHPYRTYCIPIMRGRAPLIGPPLAELYDLLPGGNAGRRSDWVWLTPNRQFKPMKRVFEAFCSASHCDLEASGKQPRAISQRQRVSNVVVKHIVGDRI